MNDLLKITCVCLLVSLFSCGGGDEPQKATNAPAPKSMLEEKLPPASERITLDDKGVGQIKEITLDPEINQDMVAEGAAIFKTNCTACHKVDKRFIGPSPKGILERRSPEWIMNMILDPQLMVEEDRCAKDLLVEFNGAAMANQNMTVEQTRAVLEYFRTL
ncbi:cytochrome c [Cryomorphaceae bacterium 1068]|nr:cytochrome c [Cryomorphaceae bacterium 1068]